jgi:hypothetical protein
MIKFLAKNCAILLQSNDTILAHDGCAYGDTLLQTFKMAFC